MDGAVQARLSGERLFIATEPPPGASPEIIGI